MSSAIRSELRALLERVVIAERSIAVDDDSEHEIDYAIRHAAELLGARNEIFDHTLADLRARIALHFAPVDAIAYDPGNTVARQTLIREYIIREFSRPAPQADQLARDVARLLNEWDQTRGRGLSRNAEALLRHQSNRCRNCGVVLWPEPDPEFVGDHYKPYYLDSEGYLAVDVDHIEPVSRFGTNILDNLQALCHMCNQGKGDLSGVDVGHERRFACAPIHDVLPAHRAKLLFFVIDRCGRTCTRSGKTSEQVELTVRPVRSSGGYVRSNLVAVAVSELTAVELADGDDSVV